MSSDINIPSPIVTVDWLYQHSNAENLIILDGTINKVFDSALGQIPKARFFDIKNKFSDINEPFPSTFPTTQQFQEEARNLGLNNNSAIVVYDDKGIYSSARVWWLLKAFGHENVAVLSGGLPAWKVAGYKTEPMEKYTGNKGDFVAIYQAKSMRFFYDVKKASEDKTHTIVDARSAARFNGIEGEPREGLRKGTIPNSKNLPFTELLSQGLLKPKEELEELFEKVAKKDDDIIFSCGSGITACVLALGATICDYEHISVYDGSWTEWGSIEPE
ncbi:sulfurtransferase [Gaetbulibacter saemankumensis]|uniref:sulfurtransferase n=1 Tax=Gaetbulibacter saemankumensis TaxID=311208 RepID=UPI000400CB6B|nr:sulfurtransferase [Gaetbulibacter saemankumensis]